MQRFYSSNFRDIYRFSTDGTMLSAGPFWYASVPGASETGPYNPHFVQDIGAAFLVAGLALAARAWRPVYWPAAVAGAGFLAAHALIHLAAIVAGHDHHVGFDLIDHRASVGTRPLFRLPEPRRTSCVVGSHAVILRSATQALWLRHKLSRNDAERVAVRLLQIRTRGEGFRPSRGGSSRRQFRGQDWSAPWPKIAVPAPSWSSTWRWKRACRRTRSRRCCAASRAR